MEADLDRDKHNAPRKEPDVPLQEIIPGFRDRHLQEVQTNHSAPAGRHGKRGIRPVGRPCSALTRWQVGQVLMNVSTSAARDGHQTERRANDSVYPAKRDRPGW